LKKYGYQSSKTKSNFSMNHPARSINFNVIKMNTRNSKFF
jgi:hypothetical protein